MVDSAPSAASPPVKFQPPRQRTPIGIQAPAEAPPQGLGRVQVQRDVGGGHEGVDQIVLGGEAVDQDGREPRVGPEAHQCHREPAWGVICANQRFEVLGTQNESCGRPSTGPRSTTN